MSRNGTLYRIIKNIGLLLFYLAAWQALSMLVGSSLLLPSPLDTGKSLLMILQDPLSWQDIGNTFLRLLAGFLLGTAAGVLLAAITARSRFLRWLLNPLRLLIKATPVMSFVLLLLVSVVSNWVPVIVAAIMVAPLLWATTEQAILSLDPKLTEMGKVYLSPIQRLMHVELPQMLPQITASAVTALGFAWKAVITAEVLSLPRFAIGNRMYLSKLYLDTADTLAWTVWIVTLALLMEWLLKRITEREKNNDRDS
ncbi:MAG: ABC transporter permease subunit [Clostridia bacterium]|nr:ABC transporter permease subunit [Clostridia bacterium]